MKLAALLALLATAIAAALLSRRKSVSLRGPELSPDEPVALFV